VPGSSILGKPSRASVKQIIKMQGKESWGDTYEDAHVDLSLELDEYVPRIVSHLIQARGTLGR
jgi:hypothetical protein